MAVLIFKVHFAVFSALFLLYSTSNVYAYNYEDLCDRNQISTLQNIYVFGSSYTDFGNWAPYFEVSTNYYLDSSGIIQPPTTWYNATSTSINIINQKGRASDGGNMIDFIANYYNYNKYTSSNLVQLINSGGNLINFAIFGASASGNVYNQQYSQFSIVDFTQITGNYGYDFQVSDFLFKLQNTPGLSISPGDVFIFDFVGGVDIPFIMACADPMQCFQEFETSIFQSMLRLYEVGMRNLLFIHLDSMYTYVPSYIKYDIEHESSVGAQINNFIANVFNRNVFYRDLVNFRKTNMPFLNLQRISYADVLSNVLFKSMQSGYRNNLDDDPDARVAAYGSGLLPSLPFPTIYDYKKQTGVYIKNTYFNDDNNPSEFSYRIMANYIIQIMRGMINQCV